MQQKINIQLTNLDAFKRDCIGIINSARNHVQNFYTHEIQRYDESIDREKLEEIEQLLDNYALFILEDVHTEYDLFNSLKFISKQLQNCYLRAENGEPYQDLIEKLLTSLQCQMEAKIVNFCSLNRIQQWLEDSTKIDDKSLRISVIQSLNKIKTSKLVVIKQTSMLNPTQVVNLNVKLAFVANLGRDTTDNSKAKKHLNVSVANPDEVFSFNLANN